MRGQQRTTRHAWLLVGAVTLGASALLHLTGLPSPVLFGGLLGGLAHALTSQAALALPEAAYRLAQGAVGVVLGVSVSGEALARMGSDAPAIALVTLGTVLISLAAGWLLSLRRDVTLVSGAFALIAGGASGVVAVSRELGADDRLVTVVQYLRVLVVLLAMPVVATLVFRPQTGLGSLPSTDASLLPSLAYVASALLIGHAVARLVPLPTAHLLGPLLVAAVLVNTGVFSARGLGEVSVPAPVEWLAFGVIGAQVGLRFTRTSLVSIARMLPVVLMLIAGMIAATAGLGALLARLTPVDGLTAYLATTPGGLFAVVALAADAGSDLTYVTAVQLARLLLILLLTPLLARWLRRRSPGPPAPAGGPGP